MSINFITRQLATLLQAGIPLVKALIMIERGENKIELKKLLSAIKCDVESGSSFAEALAKHPRYFDCLYCHLIRAGERAANLPLVLERMAIYQEKIQQLKAKIRKALLYPCVVLSVALIVSIGLLLFIVPQFEQLFKSFGATLPWLTQVVMHAAEFLQHKGVYLLFFLLLFIAINIYAYKNYLPFKQCVGKIILKIPLYGMLLHKTITARILRTLAITYHAGVPLVDALKISSETANHYLYQQAIITASQRVSAGEQLHSALQKNALFPALVIQMIAVGEESRALNQMLEKVSDIYEEEVDYKVNNLSTLLEPFIMVLLGIIVGGLVIAMYLPVFRLGSVV